MVGVEEVARSHAWRTLAVGAGMDLAAGDGSRECIEAGGTHDAPSRRGRRAAVGLGGCGGARGSSLLGRRP